MHDAAESELRQLREEMLRASDERLRLIADNVGDMIWTASMNLSEAEKALAMVDAPAVIDAVMERWRFSFISSAAERVFGFSREEIAELSLRDITTEKSYRQIREAMIGEFRLRPLPRSGERQQHVMEVEFVAKDGSPRWCEVLSTYLRDEHGMPSEVLGITRDTTERRKAEHAMRESEYTLRSLFENLPDVVATIDRDGTLHFINRGISGLSREALSGTTAFDVIALEHRATAIQALQGALADRDSRCIEVQDIFGHWWSCRFIAPFIESDPQLAMVIGTDITQERLATEAVNKEQRLLRQLLELHERERQLVAYEIHDGFAQQLTGALFRLQGFRDLHARDPVEAMQNFDSALRLISRAIDETRRLISGLRPPILDELGIVPAIEYLACEQEAHGGPKIEFVHETSFDRLAPPLEIAIFRIVQESMQNACRHSRSDKIRIELTQRGDRIFIGVRDWGVGVRAEEVAEQRFGLQGIRERVRLLDGRVEIDSAPGEGTHIRVELPLVDANGATLTQE